MSLLCNQSGENNKSNRILLRDIFSSLMYLAKQNIVILGSKENDGNCIELMELRSNEIPELKNILFEYADPSIRQRHMLSRDIQN